ncbi:MAG TPA: hypothetical protein VGG64_22860 [Pirellulales bacterium]
MSAPVSRNALKRFGRDCQRHGKVFVDIAIDGNKTGHTVCRLPHYRGLAYLNHIENRRVSCDFAERELFQKRRGLNFLFETLEQLLHSAMLEGGWQVLGASQTVPQRVCTAVVGWRGSTFVGCLCPFILRVHARIPAYRGILPFSLGDGFRYKT